MTGPSAGITGWRKSSHSGYNGNCVEVGSWRKSSRSMGAGDCVEAGHWRTSIHCAGNGSCVEATSCRHGVGVRDSRDRSGPVLTFDAATWAAFAERLKRDAWVTRRP